MDQLNSKESTASSAGQDSEEPTERSYSAYCKEQAGFDPMKDLNLPGSYDEVVKRLTRLQGDKAMETFN
jgi:hypothetical protein